jgi:hypothetical protein
MSFYILQLTPILGMYVNISILRLKIITAEAPGFKIILDSMRASVSLGNRQLVSYIFTIHEDTIKIIGFSSIVLLIGPAPKRIIGGVPEIIPGIPPHITVLLFL